LKMNTLCCYTTLELYTQWHGHIPKEINLAGCWQICDTIVRHLQYHVHESVQSLHFLLPVNIWGVLSSVLLGQSAADTRLLPKLKPVHLYGTAGLHRSTVSWQIQDAGKVCVQKVFNSLTCRRWQ
jgi:hypothetical protein